MKDFDTLDTDPDYRYQAESQAVDPNAKNILDAKYKPTKIKKFIEEQTHLNNKEKEKLKKLMNKYECLFDGTLGT